MLNILLFVLMESALLIDGRKSSLLESFGCVERRNITVIMESIVSDDLIRTNNFDGDLLFKSLNDPCHTIFLYNFNLRKFFQWTNGADQIGKEFYNHLYYLTADLPSYLELLRDLRNSFTIDNTTKQILLFEHMSYMDRDILSALEMMYKESHWNIIIQCTFNCPVLPQFPLHLIVTAFDAFEVSQHIRDLVKNPNFNKLEWLKRMKIGSVNKVAETIQNKRIIHFVDFFVSLSVMQQVALISYNTPDTIIKIHHCNSWNRMFWNSLMIGAGLNNKNIIHVFEEKYGSTFSLNDIFKHSSFTIEDMQCEGFGLGSIVIFIGMSNQFFPEEKFKNKFRGCKFVMMEKNTMFKYYDSNHSFVHNIVEDLVNKLQER